MEGSEVRKRRTSENAVALALGGEEERHSSCRQAMELDSLESRMRRETKGGEDRTRNASNVCSKSYSEPSSVISEASATSRCWRAGRVTESEVWKKPHRFQSEGSQAEMSYWYQNLLKKAWNVTIERCALEERENYSIKSQKADSGLCDVELKELESMRVIVDEVTHTWQKRFDAVLPPPYPGSEYEGQRIVSGAREPPVDEIFPEAGLEAKGRSTGGSKRDLVALLNGTSSVDQSAGVVRAMPCQVRQTLVRTRGAVFLYTLLGRYQPRFAKGGRQCTKIFAAISTGRSSTGNIAVKEEHGSQVTPTTFELFFQVHISAQIALGIAAHQLRNLPPVADTHLH
ncbi:hypothetical protein B0H14DRAFT_3137878 [Mycena olivaceomarginata]|nr:hypothetical protein B0H14DRAFT_3137878 [Mycena olivaceomarginata]